MSPESGSEVPREQDLAGWGDFHAVERELRRLHNSSEHDAALAIVLACRSRFPHQAVIIEFWVARLQACAGDPDAALHTLAAGLARGLWWSEHTIVASPELRLLRTCRGYDKVVAQCRERRLSAKAHAVPRVFLFRPRSPQPATDLLLALHGRGRSGPRFANHWRPALARGMAIAVLQSGQLMAQGLYTWGDLDSAPGRVEALYARLIGSGLVTPRRVVLAGFGEGASLAIELALRATPVEPHGFIAVAPTHQPHWQISALGAPTTASVTTRGFIYSYDSEPGRSVGCRTCLRLQRLGVDVELSTERGLAGGFPERFNPRLRAALDTILSR